MKGFDKLHIKSAVKSRNSFDLSKDHLTTMDIGQIVPLYFNETVPGDKYNLNANYFSRMAPLVKPTYGKFYFKTMSVFVPMYQLADDAEAFISGHSSWEGNTPYLRYFTYESYVNFLIVYCYTASATSSEYDFSYVNSSGTLTYRKLSDAGRYYIKVLNSLGYSVPTNVDLQTTSGWYDTFANLKLSAMPLLAFAKAYNDWMSQSQLYNSSSLTYFLKCVKHNASVTGYTYSTRVLSHVGIYTILSNIKLNYENDYFTSAWRYPNSPALSSSDSSVQQMAVPSDSTNVIYNQRGANYLDSPDTDGNKYQLEQRSLDFLKGFDDWVRRNNYSGSRVVQKIYSRFGIKTADYRSNYANVISTDSMPIQVGDVTATASTMVQSTENFLGDYAGKGIMNGQNQFNFDCSDFGYLMVLGWFTVAPMYPYGFDRSVLRVDPLDFYNPEFDGIGVDPISYGEVYTTPKPDSQDQEVDDGVFGFTERYNSYRFGRDSITGDFRKFDNDSDMNVWHTGRLLTDIRANGDMVAQSTPMNTLPQFGSEYNRIFSITDSSVDHFYMTCQFNVNAVRPMLNFNQVPRLGEGDTVLPKNGNTIN